VAEAFCGLYLSRNFHVEMRSDIYLSPGESMSLLTGTTHGRDRYRPVTAVAVDERVSLTAVVEAVADVMEAANRGGVVDHALASRIGSQIQIAVADAMGQGRITSGAQLVGQPSFRTILSQHLATTSSAHTDQEARRLMLDFMRNHANRTGSDFANFVAQFRRGGGYGDRNTGRGSDTGATSARFDGMSGMDAATFARMREVAIKHGLHWAADRPDILRMGEEAIRLFARVGLSRDSFDSLREAGFDRRQMMNMARFAQRTGLDVNEVAKTQSDSIRIFGVDSAGNVDEAERRRWRDMIDANNADPTNAEARDRLREELERRRRREGATQAEKDQADRHLELMQQVDQKLNAANTATLTADTETAAARAEREAKKRAEASAAAAETDIAGLDALLTGPATTVPAPGAGTPSPVPIPGTGAPLPPAVVTQPTPPLPAAAPTGQQAQATPTPSAASTLRA
jgi:hypothetical protein